jgi:hypothetical protein
LSTRCPAQIENRVGNYLESPAEVGGGSAQGLPYSPPIDIKLDNFGKKVKENREECGSLGIFHISDGPGASNRRP